MHLTTAPHICEAKAKSHKIERRNKLFNNNRDANPALSKVVEKQGYRIYRWLEQYYQPACHNEHMLLYPLTAENTFFSNTRDTFFRIDVMLGHRTSLSKFKKTEIM